MDPNLVNLDWEPGAQPTLRQLFDPDPIRIHTKPSLNTTCNTYISQMLLNPSIK